MSARGVSPVVEFLAGLGGPWRARGGRGLGSGLLECFLSVGRGGA